MRGAKYLQGEAAKKRNVADMLRRTAPNVPLIEAQEVLIRHARELDAQAARLEARAESWGGPIRPDPLP